MTHRIICPVCASEQTKRFVEIPDQPVFCNVLYDNQADAQQVQRGDINLRACQNCEHVFNDSFNPELLKYSPQYENSLHFSARFQQYAESLVDGLIERYDLHGKQIIDIGCGQGDFLKLMAARGDCRGVGFDESYQTEGEPHPDLTFVNAFYSEAHQDVEADLIVCRHVLEHVENSAEFLHTLRRIIGDRAIPVFFEVPNTAYTLSEHAIWDIIYEHCGYFTPNSLRHIFQQADFEVTRIEPTFGDQFLTIEARPVVSYQLPVTSYQLPTARFAATHKQMVADWQTTLSTFQMGNRRVVLWGAGSKGVTFLNIMPSHGIVSYAIDINPRKTGKFIAGSAQQIETPEFLREYQPDVVIITNQNYREEIANTLKTLGVRATIVQA